MSPLLSVIIPVYNAEKFLGECLESVCTQTVRDMEIICVNDGSEDRSPEILKNYADRDQRIRIIDQPNSGANAARNQGIVSASGTWLGFVDSDDKIKPEMFERLIVNAEKADADISHCGMIFFYPDGREVLHYGTGIKKIQDHKNGLTDLLNGTFVEPSMCNKIYRASLFQNLIWNQAKQNNEDLLYNFELFDRASLSVYEDFCGYCYRRHENSASSDWKSVKTLRQVLSVRKAILAKSSSEVRPAAYCLWLSTLVNVLNQLSVSPEEDAERFYGECRDSLKAEQKNFSVLSRRQKIAAELHLKTPVLARNIYRVYGRFSLYRYEH